MCARRRVCGILPAAAAAALLTACSAIGFADDAKPVRVGDAAPDFELQNVDGKKVKLSSFRQKKNVALVFARAHW